MTADRYMTIEEVVALPDLGEVAISDDGAKVAFVRRTADWDANEFRSHVWIHDAERCETYQLTRDEAESSSPRWAPGSDRIAYLSPVGSGDDRKQQIHVHEHGQGQGVQVSHAPDGVASFAWTPDGQGFLFASAVPEDEGLKKRKETYGDFEYVDEEYRRHCLYRLDLRAGLERTQASAALPRDVREPERKDEEGPREDPDAERLTDGERLHVVAFDVSPDGRQVALLAWPTPNLEDLDNARLHLLDVAAREVRDLGVEKPGWATPRFSPDGRHLCYTRYVNERRWFNNQALEVMDLESGETRQPLAHVDECTFPERWTQKGVLAWWQNGISTVHALVGPTGEVEELLAEAGRPVFACSITPDGEHIAYTQASATEPFEVYLDGRRVTSEHEAYARHKTSRKEVVRWRSLDGTEIEGVLSVPPDLDRSRRHPLLVVVHGGPTGTSLAVPTDSRLYPIEQFVEKGFVVLEPNYRGSAGYGESFRKLNYRDLGTGDYADVISGVDALVERGLADPERVGVMGWSQGGYISAFCTTYSDRFRAVSVGAGISDWMTYYVNTDIHPFTRMYLGGTPWDDPEVYRKTSPITYVRSARTPTLIQHGDRDHRVPVPNAYELYQGLRDVGVETRLVIFKEMRHGPDKPGLCRAIMKQNLGWFCHHILGESLEGFDLRPEA